MFNVSQDMVKSREASFRPSDLTVSPSNRLLLIANRRAGTLQVVSLLTLRQLVRQRQEMNLLSQGGQHVLPVNLSE